MYGTYIDRFDGRQNFYRNVKSLNRVRDTNTQNTNTIIINTIAIGIHFVSKAEKKNHPALHNLRTKRTTKLYNTELQLTGEMMEKKYFFFLEIQPKW